jgi:hypothetical protein
MIISLTSQYYRIFKGGRYYHAIIVDVLVATRGSHLGKLFLEKKKIPRSQRKTIEQLKNTPRREVGPQENNKVEI